MKFINTQWKKGYMTSISGSRSLWVLLKLPNLLSTPKLWACFRRLQVPSFDAHLLWSTWKKSDSGIALFKPDFIVFLTARRSWSISTVLVACFSFILRFEDYIISPFSHSTFCLFILRFAKSWYILKIIKILNNFERF